MPAIAALVNLSVPKDESINLFYNTQNANLAVGLKSGTSSDDPRTLFEAAANDQPGIILNPSRMGASYFRGLNVVVAITKAPETPNQTYVNNVSMVSPVYRKLTTTAVANTSVTMCSSPTEGWAYFLNGTQQTDVTLKEYRFSTQAISTFLKGLDIELNGSLASYYNPDTTDRFVIYQERTQQHLKEFSVKDNQTYNIGNTNDAKPGTTVAVTYWKDKAYLYYTDDDYNLRRIIKKSTGKWGSPDYVYDTPKVDPNSQLSAVTANDINHVFFTAEGDTEFTHAYDNLETI